MTNLVTLDLSSLTRLAEQATPGPWQRQISGEIDESAVYVTTLTGSPIAEIFGGSVRPSELARLPSLRKHNAAYIAAVSPDVLLRLLARLATAERQVNGIRAFVLDMKRFEDADGETEFCERVIEHLDRLAAEGDA